MNSVKHLIATYVIGIIGAVSANGANTAQVRVLPDKTQQTVGGIGGNIVYYEEWVTESKNKEAIYDTVFNGLGITALRMANWWQVNNDRMPDQAEIFLKAKEMCGDELPVIMTAWTAPTYLKSNNKEALGTLKRNQNGSYAYDDFANWWQESIEKYRELGVNPDYVSIMNEPDITQADYHSTQLDPTETWEHAGYDKALESVYNKVSKMDNAPKFLGADNIGIGWNQTQGYANKMNHKYIAGYCFHYYHHGYMEYDNNPNPAYHKFVNPDFYIQAQTKMAQDLTDRPLWMSEFSPLRDLKDKDEVYLAWSLLNGFKYNKLNYYIYWNLTWGDRENAIINIETDSSKNKTQLGFRVNDIYHGLRHFSKFVRPGMIVEEVDVNNKDIIAISFRTKDKDSSTIVMVNKSNNDYEIVVDNGCTGSYDTKVIYTATGKGIRSKDLGCLGVDKKVNMAPMSIMTITYKKVHGKLIYTCDNNDNGHWDSTKYWNMKYVPLAEDTTIIRRGEAKVTGKTKQVAPCLVEAEGTIRPTSNVKFNEIVLQGGTLRVKTEDEAISLNANKIIIEEESTIEASTTNGSYIQLNLNAPIEGDKDIHKTGDRLVSLMADNSKFGGMWKVDAGYLVAGTPTALGTKGAEVRNNSRLQIANDSVQTSWLMIDSTSKVELNNHILKVEKAEINGVSLAPGRYSYKDFINNIKGEKYVWVVGSKPKFSKTHGESNQLIHYGDSIKSIEFTWSGGDSINLEWNKKPKGIVVEMDDENQTVKISGKIDEIGTFSYNILITNSFSNTSYSYGGTLTCDVKKVDIIADGELTQTVHHNDTISTMSFKIENADTVLVTWNPFKPNGIGVELSNSAVKISGKATDCSTFSVYIYAQETKMYTSAGLEARIEVLDSMLFCAPVIDAIKPLSDSIQTGDSLQGKYKVRYADDIEVNWMPYMPDSVVVDADDFSGDVEITGVVKDEGSFTMILKAFNSYNGLSKEEESSTNISPSQTTKVDYILSDNDLNVWPNPVDDWIYINLRSSNSCAAIATLTNAEGKMVWMRKFCTTSGTNRYTVDASNLQPGVYLLKVKSEDGKTLDKVIIKK